MNYIDIFKKGSGIHIKKANRGKFTDYCGGKVTSECISKGKHSSDPAVRKRATFAANARKWKHQSGGVAQYGKGFYKSENAQDLEEQNIFKADILSRTNDIISSKEKEEEKEDTGWDDLFTEEPSKDVSTVKETATVQPTVSPELKDRQKAAMNYLMTKHGFNKEAAAGIVGVFTAESNLMPGIINKEESSKYGSKAGKGIAQWSNKRRAKYDQAMQGKSGLEAELDYFVQDLQSRPLVLDALKTATSVDDAVKAMHLGYENGSESAMSTPEQLEAIYTPAWKKLYGESKTYSYLNSHNTRLSHANRAYSLV